MTVAAPDGLSEASGDVTLFCWLRYFRLGVATAAAVLHELVVCSLADEPRLMLSETMIDDTAVLLKTVQD